MKSVPDTFRPWLILMIVCGLATGSIGISVNTNGVFYSAVSQDLGFLLGSYTLHMTFFLLATALFSLLVPQVYKRLPFLPVLRFAILAAVASTFAMSLGHSLWFFYLMGIVRGLSTTLFSMVLLTMVLNAWFVKKNGLATSICFACTGLAGSIFSPVLSWCIHNMGWRMGYVVMAILILLAGLPALLINFTMYPQQSGFAPLGGTVNTPALEQKKKVHSKGVKEAINPICLISMIVFSLLASFLTSYVHHFPGYVESNGASAALGASLLSAAMLGNVSSKLLIGVLADLLGKVKAVWVMLTAAAIGLILVMTNLGSFLLMGGALLFGATYSIAAVGMVFLSQYFFGLCNYDRVYPSIVMAGNLGAAVSLSVIGYIFDFFGNYFMAFMMAFVMFAICAGCLLLAMNVGGKKQSAASATAV